VAPLVGARTLRHEHDIGDADLTAESLLARASAHGWGTLVTGEEETLAWIQAFVDRATAAGRDAYVLWGGYHDAPGQVDAFGHLIGPGGLRGLTLVAAEQFRASGAWGGVSTEEQRGDDAELASYVERGDLTAFDRLARGHADADYAAWKFAYARTVMDLLVDARATASSRMPGEALLRFTGCDMPEPLKRVIATLPDDDRLRLRELHCVASLPVSPPRVRAALLWGQGHVRPSGLRRFFPPAATVLSIYVFGLRSAPGSAEAELHDKLALADPVLIPLDDTSEELALLYPDEALGASVDRVRDRSGAWDARGPGLYVRAPEGGRFLIGERNLALGANEEARIEVGAQERSFSLETPTVRFAGRVHVPRGGQLTLAFDAAARTIAAEERLPVASP
jgi:hypothetical protein